MATATISSVWIPTLWRFETNAYPRALLVAPDIPYPSARSNDGVPQPFRSSTSEQLEFLAGYVRQVLADTRRRKLILVGAGPRRADDPQFPQERRRRARWSATRSSAACRTGGFIVSDRDFVGSEFQWGGPLPSASSTRATAT
jgi:hypothetical protein